MTKNKKGFTIIEVVLVLAIAGLIFLMVFIALPALQRSQRNTQREDDLSRILTAANDYQTNNNGKSPWDSGETNKNFVKRYIDSTCKLTNSSTGTYTCDGDQFRDPDGTEYKMLYSGKVGGTVNNGFKFDTTGEGESSQENKGLAVLSAEFDHTFRAVTNASCGDEGQAVQGTGNRQYAVYYVLEGNSISCNDNH
ncbi:type II secretion system protein [Candidatus Saccharibacteria bacterium]|nr:type II secretion system protein [Candidatus Saccharibacteria bacterium]